MKHAANVNDVWIAIVLDALAAAGARRAALCPGGRSATMVLALRDDARFVAPLVCNDERSGAYAALGMIRASGEPAVLVTTSGSAVANAVPALTEAHECNLPLLIVSCDRPRTLRNSGFGQMIDQVGACRPFVRASVDLPDPDADPSALAALADTLARALAACDGPHPGPVHINLPLTGYFDPSEALPLPPVPAAAPRREPGPHARHHVDDAERNASGARPGAGHATHEASGAEHDTGDAQHEASGAELDAGHAGRGADDPDAVRARLGVRPGMRALVVAGPNVDVPHDVVSAFVAAARVPVLADTASELRGSGLATVLNGYDALTLDVGERPPPELVIRFGLAPVMPAVQQYLLAHPCPTLKIARVRHARDYLHPRFESLVAPSRATLLALARALDGGDPAWRATWQQAAQRAARRRTDVLDRLDWGELPALRELFAQDGFAFVHLGNSMPVRHADMFYDTRANRQSVYANRGVSGIDGTLGTFVGEAHARGDAGLLVLGDLSFLHDLPALALAQRLTTSACICVINNGGGAIFDFLPLARRGRHDAILRNAHAFDATRIAAGFGLAGFVTDSIASLRAALAAARAHPGASVVEVRVPPGSALAGMHAIASAPLPAGATA